MGGRGASVSDFAGENTVRDPTDFDVFQKGPGELWDVEESGAAGAQVSLPLSLLSAAQGSGLSLSDYSQVFRCLVLLDEFRGRQKNATTRL